MVPPDSPTAPSEVARHMPALLKMLRSLKFCDDASAEPRTRVRSRSQALGTFACAAGALEAPTGARFAASLPSSRGPVLALLVLLYRPRCRAPRWPPPLQEAQQLCDVAMVLMRQLALRLTKGKPAEPGRFPGQVVLPRMCFRPNMEGQGESQ